SGNVGSSALLRNLRKGARIHCPRVSDNVRRKRFSLTMYHLPSSWTLTAISLKTSPNPSPIRRYTTSANVGSRRLKNQIPETTRSRVRPHEIATIHVAGGDPAANAHLLVSMTTTMGLSA